MSGPAIHYIVGTKLPKEFKTRYPALMTAVAEGLRDHDVYRNVGTMGPDFLFFNTKDMPLPVKVVADLYIEVSEFIQDFKESVIGLVPDEVMALKEDLDTMVENTVEHSSTLQELQQTMGQMQGLIDALLATMTLKIEEHITDTVNVFEILTHPIQGGDGLDDWWWFDTLHYRKSGEYAAALLKNTSSNPESKEHAYAIGYLSHVACDVVGHPYVNMIAGGPYRTQPQRHKIVESFNDVWAYDRYKDDEFARSKLCNEFDFDGDLPDSICKLISKTTRDVYGNVYGNELTPEDVRKAYKLWFMWLEKTTSTGTIPEPVPYSLSGEVAEVWQQFQENGSEIWDYVSGSGSTGGGGISGFFSALAAAILGPILLAAAIIDFIAGIITTISTAGLRYMMSLAYQAVYDAYSKYRLGVSLNGLAFPLREHLNHSKIMHVNNPELLDDLGQMLDYDSYPHTKFNDLADESALVYPWSAIETVQTTSAPRSYTNHLPDYYVDGNVQYRPGIEDWVMALQESTLPQHHNKMQKEYLGNAVQLTTELYHRYLHGDPIPCFSLDGDRGIGYPCWRTDDNGAITGTNVDLEMTAE